MIAQLKGKLIEITPTHIIVDCNGVGYELMISLATYSTFQHHQEVLIYSKLIVREDAHILFGFYSKSERELFNLLISVNGVGPASALMMLSTLSIVEISQAIANGNNVLLQKVKGIGAKTAQRIIIDLRDKMLTFSQENTIESSGNQSVKSETLNALEILGVPRKTSERIIDSLLKDNFEVSVEELIKLTLKRL